MLLVLTVLVLFDIASAKFWNVQLNGTSFLEAGHCASIGKSWKHRT